MNPDEWVISLPLDQLAPEAFVARIKDAEGFSVRSIMAATEQEAIDRAKEWIENVKDGGH